MTAEKGTLIRVPVKYPSGHPLFAAAQMADDGRRVLHGTSLRAGLGIRAPVGDDWVGVPPPARFLAEPIFIFFA